MQIARGIGETDGNSGSLISGSGLERRLLVLMGARLAISVLSLGIAATIEAAGWSYSPREWRGFYGTVVFAFLATIGYGLIFGRVKRVRRFAVLNVATDIAIVSALVHLSGGSDSPFAFLYVLVAVYGSVLFERRGAISCAFASAFAYGFVLSAEQWGWVTTRAISTPAPVPVLAGMWIVHTGAVVLVAVLANRFSVELRKAGEELRQRTSDLTRLQTLHERTVESLMSGLLTTDLEGRLTYFNPEAVRLTGQRVEDVMGQDVELILPGIRELMVSAGRDDVGRLRARIPYQDQEDKLRHLGVGAYVLRNADAKPEGYIVIFQDVTDVVEMEFNLVLSERLAAVGELSASIAHELRNPLAAISGSIEMLQAQSKSLNPVGEPEQLMAIVIREVDRLNDLITDFLHYARPGPRNLESVCLAEAVDEILRIFDTTRPAGIEVSVSMGDGHSVLADAGQFRQVLWNLVLNASEAMPNGGHLRLSSRVIFDASPQEATSEGRRGVEEVEKAHWVEITVADDGIGIPPSVLDRIFDPFFTTKKNGTGLGLATVHRIVEDHGGSVRLESSVDSGTTVRLRLPRAEA